ncbi:MAG TPA: histidine phosphatase family protein [Gammaproteobacteria bacterium]|nr:histidine phosphatase family protein [Gammaproteobacteria bacterium]
MLMKDGNPTRAWPIAAAFLLLSAWLSAANAQTLEGRALVDALREGGYVIVMRHAHSPRATPDAGHAAAGNVKLERELDAEGREAAAGMGRALKELHIPIAEVLSSPTFRALETVRLMGLQATPTAELGDAGQDMKADTEGTRSAWLRNRAAQKPPAGGNSLLVTHLPNLVGAFGDAAKDTGDGEALIFRPDGRRAELAGRVSMDEWPRLAAD